MSQTVHAPLAGRKLRVAASPRARRLMRQLGIDAQSVRGSGPGGRILEADVRRAPAAPARSDVRPPGSTESAASTTSSTSSMRRAIARLTTASATVPQFYVRAEADAQPFVALREQLIERVQADTGVRLTFTDLLLRAQVLALTQLPEAAATWREGELVPAESVDVGVVVGVPGGLLIPVVKRAHTLSLAELTRARHELVSAARAGRLAGEQLSGGISSLSNLGNGRVDEFTALVAPPQSSILAVGRIAPRPTVVDNQLVVRPTVKLTLSADHRVLDGVLAGELLSRIVRLIEQPALLLYS